MGMRDMPHSLVRSDRARGDQVPFDITLSWGKGRVNSDREGVLDVLGASRRRFSSEFDVQNLVVSVPLRFGRLK